MSLQSRMQYKLHLTISKVNWNAKCNYKNAILIECVIFCENFVLNELSIATIYFNFSGRKYFSNILHIFFYLRLYYNWIIQLFSNTSSCLLIFLKGRNSTMNMLDLKIIQVKNNKQWNNNASIWINLKIFQNYCLVFNNLFKENKK